MKKRMYISGKISGLDNFEQEFEKYIKSDIIWYAATYQNFVIVNPVKIKPFLNIKKWLFYMISDLYHLSKCTHIAMIPNWRESRGACIEHYFAQFILKIPVIYL